MMVGFTSSIYKAILQCELMWWWGLFHLNWIPFESDRIWLKKAHASKPSLEEFYVFLFFNLYNNTIKMRKDPS
jgi:hypothetical protein